jgi:plastocyanin
MAAVRWLARGAIAVVAAAALAAVIAAASASPERHAATPTATKRPAVKTGSGGKTRTYKWGPVKLAAFTVKRDTAFPRPPHVNGYLTAMSVRLVDRHNRPIPIRRVMLHHLLFSNDGRFKGDHHDGACPDIPRERFFGRGEEGLTLDLPDGYGYRLRKRDRWRMNWMLMNHTTRREAAYIQYRMKIVRHRRLTPVTPFWLDVARCHGGSIFTNPGNDIGGSTYSKAVGWRVPFNGRIVDAGTHLHGGALDMKLRQPACHRTLIRSHALYGMPDDPVYRVRPILHEPGPVATTIVHSHAGIRVRKGERLKATTLYDNRDPHAAAMAMWHIYVAHAKRPATRCPALPSDVYTVTPAKPTRATPPHFPVPLVTYDGRRWHDISRPPGRTVRYAKRRPSIKVRTFGFHPANLSVPSGARLRWRFPDPLLHNVTIATGPYGFASLHLSSGASFKKRLTRPGTYRLYCSLHPTLMQEVVTVRPR